MKLTRLANGLDVTAIGLGSAPLGGLFSAVSDADAEATLAAGWSAGIRFYDTAAQARPCSDRPRPNWHPDAAAGRPRRGHARSPLPGGA